VVDGGRTGKKCLRISGEEKNVQIRLKHLPTEREKRSVISGWMKVVAGEGTVALSHRYEDAAGRPIAGSMSIGGINAKNNDWTMTSMIDDKRTELLGSSTMDVTESKDWQPLSVDTRDNNQNGATHITATAVCHGDAEAFFDQLVLIAK
jgi:hypothetical protein